MLSSNQQFKFASILTIINVIADSTHGYFSWGLFNPGFLRTYIIFAFIIAFYNKYFKQNQINNLIVFTLTYFLLLSLLTSDVAYTFSIYLKYFMATMMFPIGYYYFNSLNKYKKLLNSLGWTLGLYGFFLIIANIFGLGTSDYLEGSVNFGAGRVNATKAMMILLFPVFLLIRNEETKSKRIIFIAIFIIGIVFVFLGIKRSALLGVIVGFPLYYLLTPYKGKLIIYIFSLIVVLALMSPLFLDDAIMRFQARQEAGRFDLEQVEDEEARYIEIIKVKDAFINGDIIFKLFGKEFFNSPEFFNTRRMLHTDYATMLQGSGILGLGLFLYLYYLIIRKINFYRRVFWHHKKISDILSIMFVVVVVLLITGISGSVTTIGLRSIVFLFLGGSFSYIEHEYYKIRKI